jgi:citrate lyase subunit beta/citryl-CoA lyase
LYGVRLDAGDAQHRHENSSARGKFDHEPEHSRLSPTDTHGHHDVAGAADGFAVGAEYDQTREPGREYLTQSCHDGKVSLPRHEHENRQGAKDLMSSVEHARPRRSVLAVPGSSAKMIEKAKGLPADAIFLDLEDAVASIAKVEARGRIVEALNSDGWGSQIKVVRVNDWTTPWTHGDVIDVVSGAGANLDAILLPKVEEASHVQALDLLLTQVEKLSGLPVGAIGIEPQIESARSLRNIDSIATASPRVQTLVFGPADLMASVNMRTLVVGEQPEGYDTGDAYHHILMTILLAARTHGLQAIDGPYLQIRDLDAFRRAAGRTAGLGFDGKWVLHPTQIDAANEIFSPRQTDFDKAEQILEAYEFHTSEAGGGRGAVMLGDEMIDEASRKMALVVSGKGRAAGMTRSEVTQASPEGAVRSQ